MKLREMLIVSVIGAAAIASACSSQAGIAPVNTDANGFAVRGYDTVAFFADNATIQGSPAFEYVWKGAKWAFANAENLEKFKRDPEAFAPQFGGYCSYAVSHGYTADGDPNTFKIVDGKLYLNYNEKAKAAWEAEQEKLIKEGEKNWTGFQTKKPEHKK